MIELMQILLIMPKYSITTNIKANANTNAIDNAHATVNVTGTNANTKAKC